ncbi:hypothetical protein LOTGIDRAFT_211452 [Lottia gigantea]|uniref:Alpha-2-macroglobulin domain-containing protein n=1 Tax=Lottia gigantea TaxID=225164 RepID=V3ZK97_LOTGI|nr:hypothetical protein LOTGIDRAFT_211452 [Lottia gigantea]ESO82800.1 hypothetical protein LOTGIDRAFT_211452 [Lottia gigantea]
MTDIDVYYREINPFYYEDMDDVMVDFADNGPAPNAGMGVGGSVQKLAEVKHVRKYFPETWLWESGKTGLNGEFVFSSRVPDTITSWFATAFSVSPTNGLGLTTTPAKLNAFQKFFVSLNLPYSIRRGENFELLASVSNYLKQDINVVVTLKRSDDFAVLNSNSLDEEYVSEEMIETILVKSDSVKTISFRIQPKKLGDITVSVKAQPPQSSGEDGDAVDKTVFVKPEGFKMMNATSFYVDLSETTAYDDEVDIWYPIDVVSGSRRAEVQVTGDVMGPALDGLEKLLQVPYGCGEQNMISFVPNIYVCDYLTSVGKITEDIRSRSVKNMQRGYQRELKYRHGDGSFSAFGESDESGSTWLTAFVLKSYTQASSYITVDSSIQSKSVQFLKNQLNKNGSFNEPGRVIHTEMLGGAGRDNKGLTAFVLTAMLESKDHIDPTLYEQATRGSINYLEGLVDKNGISRTYEKAIILYGLTLAKSPKANVLLNQLMDANFEKPWSRTDTVTTKSPVTDDIRITPYHPPKATASDVETWAYVLLSLCELDRVAEARPTVKWLMSQQNSFGGYHSSQDTVVTLQALASFAKKTSSAEKDMIVNVDANGLKKTFTVNKDNSLILQSVVLSDDSRNVKVRATGSGTAIVKVMWRYHSKTPIPSLLPQNGQNKAPIILRASTNIVSNGQSVVSACVKCAEDIGMSMISFDMPSGNTPTNVEELKKNKQIKRVEEKDEALHLYLDKIPESESCFNVELMQTQDVKNIQDAPIIAKAYYQTEIETSVLYNIAEKSVDFCDMCKGDGCVGCSSSMANNWNKASLTAVALICVLLSIIFAI